MLNYVYTSACTCGSDGIMQWLHAWLHILESSETCINNPAGFATALTKRFSFSDEAMTRV